MSKTKPLAKLKALPLASIEYDGQPDADNVAGLMSSMVEVGQLLPIFVVQSGNGGNGFRVVEGCGRDRVEAASRLGWSDIEARILASDTEEDRLRAELSAIDEALYRKKLSPAAEARLVVRRKEVYERLHPEARQGVSGGKARQGSAVANSAIAEQASESGRSTRTLRRAARRGAELGNEILGKIAGTSLDKGEELDALLELPDDKRQAVIERAVSGDDRASAKLALQQHRRDLREIEAAGKIMSIPGEKAGILYLDLPWKTVNWSVETGSGRAAESHYTTMTLAEIEQFPIDKFAADDCYLLPWTTGPFLWEALRIFVQCWGFKYVSRITWGKVIQGTGRVVVDKSEELLILKRGSPVAPARGKQPLSLYDEPEDVSAVFDLGGRIDIRKTGHSAKPDFFAEMIEKHWPNTPKRELFGRGETRPGWLAKWGYQVDETVDDVAEGIDGDGQAYADDDPGDAADTSDLADGGSPPGNSEGDAGGGVAGVSGDRSGSGVSREGAAQGALPADAEDPFAELSFHRKPRPEMPDIPPSLDRRPKAQQAGG